MDDEIIELIRSIDQSMQDIAEEKPEEVKVPSNLQILFSGVSDSIGVQNLFSDKVDSVIGKLFDSIISGKFDVATAGAESLNNILGKVGLNDKSFEGELSQRILNSISSSINSTKFNKTRSNLKKCLIVLRNLKREIKIEEDKEKRKKLEDAFYAIKRVLRVVNNIYKQRKLITKRVKQGLNTIVNEQSE